MLTHQVRLDPERQVVTKRFRNFDRGEPEREWRALGLLAEHAPGLAPAPVSADLDAAVPVIEMSLLPGEPLGGQALTAAQESGLVMALGLLWQAVPVGRVVLRPGENGNQAQLIAEVTRLAATAEPAGTAAPGRADDPVVRKAVASGIDWLSWGLGGAAGPARYRVFGQGDANLANFLWDGERVRIVDFEDSGPSERAFELAVLVEHISAWYEAGLDAERFAGAFELTAAERARLADWRRLAALFWLLRLGQRPAGQLAEGEEGNRARRQAERLLELL